MGETCHEGEAVAAAAVAAPAGTKGAADHVARASVKIQLDVLRTVVQTGRLLPAAGIGRRQPTTTAAAGESDGRRTASDLAAKTTLAFRLLLS